LIAAIQHNDRERISGARLTFQSQKPAVNAGVVVEACTVSRLEASS